MVEGRSFTKIAGGRPEERLDLLKQKPTWYSALQERQASGRRTVLARR